MALRVNCAGSMSNIRTSIAVLVALGVPACTGEIFVPDDPLEVNNLDEPFAQAARTYGVPVDVLAAVSYVETTWNEVTPEDEGDTDELGRQMAFGVMGLRGEHLVRGAAAAGLDVETVRTDTNANITAAAALLAELAREEGVTGDSLEQWTPVIARYAGIDDAEAAAGYVEAVMGTLVTGARSVAEDGRIIAELAAHPELEWTGYGTPGVAYVTGGGDHGSAVWRPSPNYSARSSSVSMVVIHTCEGNYAGCWGWLRNGASGVSAHYVVSPSGGEITQLVREANKAWHVGADYVCSRAGNTQCGKNGINVNNFAVGIEHAGFASQASWSNGLVEASAKLVCDITRRHNIPRDRYHIIGHGKLQPYNRTDPGAHWPWEHYLDRVRAHCGDGGGGTSGGSGGGTTTPTTGDTIIVDSNNARNNANVARLELAGTWTSSAMAAGYYGTGYWFAETAATSAPATFWFYLPKAETRTIDAWWTAGTNRSAGAPFIGFNASGKEVGRRVVDQTQRGSQWVTLGTWSFSAGWNKVVLSRWAASGKVVIADAVRVR